VGADYSVLILVLPLVAGAVRGFRRKELGHQRLAFDAAAIIAETMDGKIL